VVVLDINKDKQEISLGMKQTEVNPWELVAEKYPPGTIIEGEVRNLANYGAFIEIEPGIDGLLHISDMSWTKKVTNPQRELKKGDNVQVRRARGRPGEAAHQPRRQAAHRGSVGQHAIPSAYQPGMVVRGKVTKITNFGVFVELEDGLEGLLHISELADHKVENPQDVVVEAGDEPSTSRSCASIRSDRKIGLSKKRADWAGEEVGAEGDATESSADSGPRKERRGGLGEEMGGGFGDLQMPGGPE
jgi:small subunit ribosomal protein S1